MASERSALVGAEAEQLRRDQQDDNRPWAAALAFGAWALLVLIVALPENGTAAEQDADLAALREEVRALQRTTPALHPAAELRPITGVPGATLLALQPERVAAALPMGSLLGEVLAEAGPIADAVGAELLWLEGPAMASAGTVLFFDTIAGQLLSWDAATGLQVVADPSGAARQ